MTLESPPESTADVTHPGGMRANRVFPTSDQSHVDPFVVFEHFHIEPWQGFDTHPHRGFEIVSYMLEGGMKHEDSMEHSSTARAGDAMRITTGSGMEHSELPAGDAPCTGLQLWVNLPREDKQVDPSYEDAEGDDLPVTETDGATVNTVVGDGSPLDLHTPMEYYDARIESSWTWDVPENWNGFLYAISGNGSVGDWEINATEYAVIRGDDAVSVTTDSEIRVAAIMGRPHGEPIRQRGPFVE